ncbi:LOW QUALITY PROTEIN: UDP-glucose 4-epimerase [Gryllus bimaculatus]|nr:LOW QUALITY PROTEIN: UDP-glucose 4-epimerase [Gryllus bimaculatus]
MINWSQTEDIYAYNRDRIKREDFRDGNHRSEVQKSGPDVTNSIGGAQRTEESRQSPASHTRPGSQATAVTGGAGFVGSHLVDQLMLAGHEVIVVDNFFTGRKRNVEHWIGHENFELIHHDIVNPLFIEVDEIYHLASPASPPHYMYNPVKTIKTNTVGTINMLGLAKRVGAKVLIASTSEVYGDPEVHPQPETYWGHVYGHGKQTRSFQYVSDLVDGLIALMASNYTQPVNLGNPTEHTIEEFAVIIKELVGGPSHIQQVAAVEDDPQRRKPDISRAKRNLGWEPKVPLNVGLRKTVKYFSRELQRTSHAERNVYTPALAIDANKELADTHEP